MQNRELYIKNKLTDYANVYKTIADFSILSIKQNNVTLTIKLLTSLNRVFERILNFIKISCPEDLYKKCEEYDFEELPEFLSPLKVADAYMKILSLKCLNLETDNVEEKLFILKMSLALNYKEEIPYINLADFLYKNKKYSEAIALCNMIKNLSNSAPAWEISAKSYRKLKRYSEAIEDYNTYISINEGDDDGKTELEKIYKESLK